MAQTLLSGGPVIWATNYLGFNLGRGHPNRSKGLQGAKKFAVPYLKFIIYRVPLFLFNPVSDFSSMIIRITKHFCVTSEFLSSRTPLVQLFEHLENKLLKGPENIEKRLFLRLQNSPRSPSGNYP